MIAVSMIVAGKAVFVLLTLFKLMALIVALAAMSFSGVAPAFFWLVVAFPAAAILATKAPDFQDRGKVPSLAGKALVHGILACIAVYFVYDLVIAYGYLSGNPTFLSFVATANAAIAPIIESLPVLKSMESSFTQHGYATVLPLPQHIYAANWVILLTIMGLLVATAQIWARMLFLGIALDAKQQAERAALLKQAEERQAKSWLRQKTSPKARMVMAGILFPSLILFAFSLCYFTDSDRFGSVAEGYLHSYEVPMVYWEAAMRFMSLIIVTVLSQFLLLHKLSGISMLQRIGVVAVER
ncbi:MAG: hypothetical protein AAF530_10170 [Pseudomonadota bacterium]